MNKIEQENIYDKFRDANVENTIYTLDFDIEQFYETKDENVLIEQQLIKFSKKGLYIGKHAWHRDSSEADKVLEELVENEVDWTSIKTLYRYPHLSLSRDKVALLKDKYGTKIIRDRDKADVCVISSKTVDKLISNDMYYGNLWTLPKFLVVKMPQLKNVMTEKAYEYLERMLCNLNDDTYIFGGDRYNSWNNSDAFEKSKLTYFTQGKWRDDSGHNGAMYVSESNIKEWMSFKDPTKHFVSDIYVNEVCSEDSIILDWEYYTNVKKMLSATSEDKDVAMTLMANCQIEKSKTALGLLFFHYGENMKGTKVWNQVAFKTLRKQFDHYMISGWNSGHTSTFTSLVEKLAKDDALTEDAMKHICELVFERVLMGSCGFSKDECAFEMELKDVRLTKAYKDKLKKEDKTLSELVTADLAALPF